MTTVQEIQIAIEALPQADYAQLRHWFSERDWELWDEEIERDSGNGKLDFLIAEAFDEKSKGLLEEI